MLRELPTGCLPFSPCVRPNACEVSGDRGTRSVYRTPIEPFSHDILKNLRLKRFTARASW